MIGAAVCGLAGGFLVAAVGPRSIAFLVPCFVLLVMCGVFGLACFTPTTRSPTAFA